MMNYAATQALLQERMAIAEESLSGYKFGDDLSITDTGSWVVHPADKDTLRCAVILDDENAKTIRSIFKVVFESGSRTCMDVYALDLDSGNEIGELFSDSVDRSNS